MGLLLVFRHDTIKQPIIKTMRAMKNFLQQLFFSISSSSSMLSARLIVNLWLATFLIDWFLLKLSWRDLVYNFPLIIFIKGDSISWAHSGWSVLEGLVGAVSSSIRGEVGGFFVIKGGGRLNLDGLVLAFATTFLLSSINLARGLTLAWFPADFSSDFPIF